MGRVHQKHFINFLVFRIQTFWNESVTSRSRVWLSFICFVVFFNSSKLSEKWIFLWLLNFVEWWRIVQILLCLIVNAKAKVIVYWLLVEKCDILRYHLLIPAKDIFIRLLINLICLWRGEICHAYITLLISFIYRIALLIWRLIYLCDCQIVLLILHTCRLGGLFHSLNRFRLYKVGDLWSFPSRILSIWLGILLLDVFVHFENSYVVDVSSFNLNY